MQSNLMPWAVAKSVAYYYKTCLSNYLGIFLTVLQTKKENFAKAEITNWPKSKQISIDRGFCVQHVQNCLACPKAVKYKSISAAQPVD